MKNLSRLLCLSSVAVASVGLVACGDSGAADSGTSDSGGGSIDSAVVDSGHADHDSGGGSETDTGTAQNDVGTTGGDTGTAGGDGGAACSTFPDDYTPRVSNSSTDGWPACVTDTATTYPRISTSIGSIARVQAFDTMFSPSYGGNPGLLYGADRDPTASQFTMARMAYQTDDGLESRIGRRPDTHYPEPTRPGTCTDEYICRCLDVAAANPDYCAGPALLRPVVQENLNRGITGDTAEPARLYAARAEAALAWTLYLSSYKESLSCDEDTADCDSAWAYYTGGEERASGLGLARLVRGLDPATHDRVWDGLLAVRCWRDIDTAVPPTMTNLRDRARIQQDRALIRGMIDIIEDRLHSFSTTTGDTQRAHLAWLRVLLAPIAAHQITDGMGNMFNVAAHPSLFDRTLRSLSASAADYVAAEIVRDAAMIDADEIAARLDATYPCN